MALAEELILLFLLPIPIACITWTVTHEEIARELREFCKAKTTACPHLYQRKLFYIFTCEYCFSQYVTAAVLLLTRYRLVYDDWRGYFVAGFSLVWIANVYMSFYGRIRLDLKRERAELANVENGKGK